MKMKLEGAKITASNLRADDRRSGLDMRGAASVDSNLRIAQHQGDTLTYLVCDIEADGPDPSKHSLLAIGAVACDARGREVAHFARNLSQRPDATSDAGTMAWWRTLPEAWAGVTRDAAPAEAVMAEFVAFVRSLPQPVVFTAHPIAFDGAWIDWYLRRFVGLSLLTPPRADSALFAGPGLDLPSFAAGVLPLALDRTWRKAYPPAFYDHAPHTHDPLADARGYAALLARLLERLADRRDEGSPAV